MKKLIIAPLTLWSFTSFAISTASLEYTCQLNQSIRTGKVEINEEMITGRPSCMFFKKALSLCFRFERIGNINDIFLSLRKSDDQGSGFDPKFISLTNIPFQEGAVSEFRINKNLLNQEDLICTYTNVNWDS